MGNGIVSDTIVGKIQFYEDHTPVWTTNSATIGVPTSEVTALATKTATARAAYDAQQTARNALKSATVTLHVALDAMTAAGSAAIKKIRAKAATDGNSVYAAADLPAPATPTPVGKPGTPTNFAATLRQDGTLELTWDCANPAGSVGTMYQVQRRVGGGGAFVLIGGSGVKSFVDDTLPAGAAGVTYQVTAVRSTAKGDPAQFNVNFGCAPGGTAIAA